MITTKNVNTELLTPLLLDYREYKIKYSSDVIMYRVGSFFETYFEDAVTLHKVTGVVLTSKAYGTEASKKSQEDSLENSGLENKGGKLSPEDIMDSTNRIPWAGVQFKHLFVYSKKLIQAGYRVIVVDQLEDPKLVKGRNVRRGLTMILTSLNIDELVDDNLNNFTSVIYYENGNFGLCFADISTQDIYLTNVDSIENVLNEVSRYRPMEILMTTDVQYLIGKEISKCAKIHPIISVMDNVFDFKELNEIILKAFNIKTLDALKFHSILELKSLCALLKYIEYIQKDSFDFGSLPVCYDFNNYLSIDLYSRANLELTENIVDNTNRGTLFSVINNCKTGMGSRKLKQWISNPLQSKVQIERRSSAIEELVNCGDLLETIQDSMVGLSDISRIMGRLKLGRVTPRDLVNLRSSLKKLPEIRRCLGNFASSLLKELYQDFNIFTDLTNLLDESLLDNPVGDIQDGLVIRKGYNSDLDTARDMIENSNKYLIDLEGRERVNTGIKNLKVVNKNGKCTIEVTKVNLDKVPNHYRIEKALKSSTRYVTDESEKLERDLYSAIERSKQIEVDLFEEIKEVVKSENKNILLLCDILAQFDVLSGLARTAKMNKYICPKINTNGIIDIKAGRHPVVEKNQEHFVSNDTKMDLVENQFLLITGPNMAGKSTYMRQVALIVLLAHIGSFVPADYADICIVDKIFTRIGASDDISAGKSTYKVEMDEVNNILRNATRNSLILLDEVGRGTSSSDGMAMAQAISEYISKSIGCKTLFATHYHELIDLENQLDGFRNYHMAVNRVDDTLEFVWKFESGGLSESYGIDVAKLSGIPDEVIDRARELLVFYDTQKQDLVKKVQEVEDSKIDIRDELRKRGLSISDLRPLTAWNLLKELISELE